MDDVKLWIIIGLLIWLIILVLWLLISNNKKSSGNNTFDLEIKHQFELQKNDNDRLIQMLEGKINYLTESINNNMQNNSNRVLEIKEDIEKLFSELKSHINDSFITMNTKIEERLNYLTSQTEQKLNNMSNSVTESIRHLEAENNNHLKDIQHTVDEKLQKTLEDKLSKSFNTVSDNLEKVYRGLGEMQTLASGVGDLKNVLSNVKTRGILGEIQLGNILQQILSSEQYLTNVETKKGSNERVEFAIKIPSENDEYSLLPIDAKFPLSEYQAIVNADSIKQTDISKEIKELIKKIKVFAKDINQKYIDYPYTTEFAIMFLPIEGLYAEVVKSGVTEELQRKYKIIVAGPTTMAAMLNSLQIGFKTIAIQRRSNDVWKLLGAIKTEFNQFGDVLASAQKKLNQVGTDLDKLVGVRSRNIQKRLNSISELSEIETSTYLPLDEEETK